MPPPTLHSHLWPEPVTILAVRGEDAPVVTVEAVGLRTRVHYTTSLPAADWHALQPDDPAHTFDAPAQPFRLALEAERLRLAYTADPLLAANNARVDLLPHQMEAVYGVMLPQPRIRHLLAHDAGAGKTIMGGLLYKELAGRQPDLRALIVAPAALTRQWQRELRDKFLVEFEIADRDSLRGDLQFWTTAPRLITSTPFARQPDVQATLANVPWDLVIVDEAHHMAGYEDRQTQAYALGRILARNARHLVLATATPHKGDRANFLKLLQLLDGDIHDPAIVNQRLPGQRGNPIMLRRLKEEMVDFDGQRLFKERVVVTRLHAIGHNPPEMDLYTALTHYISDVYQAAERIGGATRVNTQFAMVILQRRMASSLAALAQSLIRRRDSLLLAAAETAGEMRWMDAEEAAERQRWQQEAAAELASPAWTRAEREREAAEIDKLLALLNAVRQTGRETKVEKLREVMAEAGVAPDNGERLLVFTEAMDTLLFLRRLFEGWGYDVTQIDGSMDMPARLRAEDDFRHRCQIMVATEAAGEGINLQFCARMINYDLPWVPTRLEQRMGRIHRYGQRRVARIYNLAATDTREGAVLVGLLDRLEEMRVHLGDGVYDVVSDLVGDAAVARLMAGVSTAAPIDDAQDRALRALAEAMERGRQRRQQAPEPPCPIDRERFRRMQAASRQSRLTPEYAQHFFVDALQALREAPTVAGEEPAREPGDAAVLGLTLQRTAIAGELGLPARRPLLFTFRKADARPETDRPEIAYLALGTPVFDRLLDLAGRRWGDHLRRGAKFIDPDRSPGDAYLLWFLTAAVRDGQDGVVAERLFAVRQSAAGFDAFPPAALADLMPTDNPLVLPKPLPDLAGDPQRVIDWSLAAQQLTFLAEVRAQREVMTALRREPLLSDAHDAERDAQTAHDSAVFSADASFGGGDTERTLAHARARVRALDDQFAREAACSLGPTAVIAVAAVFAPDDPPPAEHADERPDVAAAAMAFVRAYETAAGRALSDQTGGYHSGFPYDLHSTGPGGPRRIEVKGTTTGRVILSETERHAAQRFREQYYLYIVRDPLGQRPALAIVRDPWARMTHDDTLYSGARYVYNARTWAAAADQEIPL